MPPGFLGIGNLTKKLTKILFTHIKVNLPTITQEIKEKIRSTEQDLRELGAPMPVDINQKTQLLWNMINEFMNTYKNTISGRFDNKRVMNTNMTKSSLSGGAKIKEHFYNLYMDVNPIEIMREYTDADIQHAIQLHEGDGLAGFPSVDVFTYLVSPKLADLRGPAVDLVQETYAQLENIANSIVSRIFQRFPTMINEIMDVIVKTLGRERDATLELVEAILDSEQHYHFTNDESYLHNRSDIVAGANQNQPGGQGQPGGPGGNPGMQQH